MREMKMVLRWSLVTAVLIALFWTVWYLATGSVPVVNEIKITTNRALALPFGVSRWWDVLIGPIWSAIFVFMFTHRRVKEEENLTIGIFTGLVYGLMCGILWGLSFGAFTGLVIGVVSGITVIIIFGLIFRWAVGLLVGLSFGLAYGLAFGLGYGLVLGLLVVVAFGLALGTVVLLGNRQFWAKARDWMLVR